MANRLASVAALAIVLSPQLANACSVCMTGKDDETRAAFIAMTAFMTFLPIGLIGGLVWWLRRRALARQSIESPRLVHAGREFPSPSLIQSPQGNSDSEGRRSRQPGMIA
jgi:hypothetical protein